ncbi:MAG: HipA N-terminal domain-containing protein [Sediminibacterium sp.]
MRGAVYNNEILAGHLEKTVLGEYVFTYTDAYYQAKEQPAISLTLPKKHQQYKAGQLFPFFHGLLSEGVNKDIQCRALKIDEKDAFKRLLKTTHGDNIGAITIKAED